MQNREGFYLEQLKLLSEINTFHSNLEGLRRVKEHLISLFSPLGGEISSISLPDRQILTPHGDWKREPVGDLIRISKRRPHTPSILLGGHMDSVFPPQSPFQKVTKDGNLWRGPALADMKGGIIILLAALESFEKGPYANCISWEVLLSPDEEIGSPSSASLWKEAAKGKAFALIFEPKTKENIWVSKRAGSLNYALHIGGRSAHVGRDFSKGRHAVYALVEWISLLQKKSSCLVNVSRLSGGETANSVPDHAFCTINARFHTEQEGKDFQDLLAKLLLFIEKKHSVTLTLSLETKRPPRPFEGKQKAFMEAAQKSLGTIGIEQEFQESMGVCDGNLLEGLPCIDTMGFVGKGIHSEKECIDISEFSKQVNTCSLLLSHYAQGKLVF